MMSDERIPIDTDDGEPEISRRTRWGLLALVGALAIALAGVGGMLLANLRDDGDALAVRDERQLLDPPKELADFTLTSHTGEPLALSNLRGRPVLLFFGYTHCPDVCPTTLGEFKAVKRALGDAGADVAFVFVSVDGARDTPEQVAAYLSLFDPSFIGLTGDEEQVRAIGQDFFVFFERSAGTTSDGYTVDHTAYSYLIDAEGKLRAIYPFNTAPPVVADDLQALLAGG